MIDISVGEHFGLSDHNSIRFRAVMDKDKSDPWVRVFDWARANYIQIRQELGNVDWEQLFEGKCISGMWEAFKYNLIKVQDMHVPAKLKDKNGKIQEPCMTREFVNLVKRKKDAYDKSGQLQPVKALEEYREIRKELKCGIRKAKRGHEMSSANRVKEHPKAFYAYIRRRKVAREKVGPLKDKGGNLCGEPQEVGKILNKYFVLVFAVEKDMTDVDIRDECVNTLENVSILKEEVLGILNCIKVDKSPGPDGIYPRLLREAREEIAGALADIFTSSLTTSEVPE
eukprot:g19566.t1